MVDYQSKLVMVCVTVVVLVLGTGARGEERAADDGLVEFTSKEGKFTVRLPGKPEHEVVEVGGVKDKQHQFKVGAAQGAYVVSYQDNPNLEGSSPKRMAEALESGRDRLKEVFRGKVLENKAVTLKTGDDGSGEVRTTEAEAIAAASGTPQSKRQGHPGLDFRLTIPEAGGEVRARFYMVGTRLYQIMAIGVPEFANGEEAGKVIESFKLL